MDEINEHYIKQAEEYGLSKQSTMKDTNTRDKEVEMLVKYITILKKEIKNPKILEIGCGNGYTAEEIINKLNLTSFIGIDFCEDFIRLANSRNLKNAIFQFGDVLNLEFKDWTFDIIFTERCLINLDTWDKEQKAFNEIRRILKPGGYYIMIESFTDGLENLNEARSVVGLNSIPQPFHNLYFDKEKFIHFIKDKFEILNTDPPTENFLSSYYFGCRVLYPALIEGKKDLVYNNKFIEFFKYLPAYGDYGTIKMFILKKMN